MPELPEVEAARCLLEQHCCGRTLTACTAIEAGGHARTGEFDGIVFDDPEMSAATVPAMLVGKKLIGIHRRGKQLYLQFDSPSHLLAHFGMTGAFVVKGVTPMSYQEFKVHDEVWPPRFTKLELGFDNGAASLAFCDPRRLGRLRLRTAPEQQDPWKSLAPDALLEPLSAERAAEALAGTTMPIKALLLDQAKLVSGVGNWVADEVLFHAAIHPEAACNTLSPAQIDALCGSLTHIVKCAVDCCADSSRFPSTWLFHHRWGKGKGADGAPKVPGPNGGAISFLTGEHPEVTTKKAAKKRGGKSAEEEQEAAATCDTTVKRTAGRSKRSRLPTAEDDGSAAAEDATAEPPPSRKQSKRGAR